MSFPTLFMVHPYGTNGMCRVGPRNWRDLNVEAGTTAITFQQFLLVRKLLEEFEDFGILRDVSATSTVIASKYMLT